MLLKLGVDCEVLDDEWMTAEEEAQEMGEIECVLLLRDHHAQLAERRESSRKIMTTIRACARHLWT